MDQEHITIVGTIEAIIFFNPETLYTVLQLEPEKMILGHPLVTMTGIMPEFGEGEVIQVIGYWTHHQKYGQQFQVTQAQRVLPVSREGILGYLKSGLITGVGEKTAEQIVGHFDKETLNILDSEDAIERLQEIPKIGQKTAEKIVAAWRQHRSSADVLMFFQQYGIGTGLAGRIYRHYYQTQDDVLGIVKENPYRLSFDINGVGFKTADRLAQNMGLPPDSPFRVQAAVVHVLEEATQNGHVYLPVGDLDQAALALLGDYATPETISTAITTLTQQNFVHLQELPHPQTGEPHIAIYKNIPFYCEIGSARRVMQLLKHPVSALLDFQAYTEEDWTTAFVRDDNETTLTSLQQRAIQTALTNRITILTGGPGTGKTTTLQHLISILEDHDISYALTAPTGRAAKRMNQATGRDTSTVHRLLGFTPFGGFAHDENYPLPQHFIVVDEASMLDIFLFSALMDAINNEAHLLLVGDVDQLPSVGAGDVLHDLIRSGTCPVVRLDQIFRQGKGSLIIQNAHLVNQGQMPELTNEGEDFYFFNHANPISAAELLVDIVDNRIPSKFGFDALTDIQVLSPMYRSPVGVEALNQALQLRLNPPSAHKQEVIIGKQTFREGDKVMQLKNNYEKKVFNGDIGWLVNIDKKHRIYTIVIDDYEHDYDHEDMNQITLAYACSVHRSQGGEYPVIVMPLLTQHYLMLQRNLLYTAITRARKLAVLVGTRQAINIAVRNDKVTRRWTALDWRLEKMKMADS